MRRLAGNFLIALFALIASTAEAGAGVQAGGMLLIRAPRQTAPGHATWEGTYKFNESGGRTAAATSTTVEHTIVVYRRGGELVADVDAAGFQTSVSLTCDVKVEGDRISFYFRSYREDNVLASYRRGQLLFSLERTIVRGRPRLLTYWGAYRPGLGGGRSGRVYLRKTK